MTAQDRAERRSERSDWLTAEQMAALCGVSVATVKRRCEDGKPIKCRDGTLVEIESERISRPQGWEWRVRTMTAPPALSTAQGQVDQEDAPALTSVAHGTAEIIRAAIDPYVTINQRLGEAYAGAMAENRDLSERVGRAEAERDSLHAAHAECSNLSHAEASRFVQEATEQRFRADDLAARLAAAEARAAEAERRGWWWRWWRILG